MALGTTCLLLNTEAVENIKNAMRMLVSSYIKNGESALFPKIFSELTKNGLEVDAQTLGTLYSQEYGVFNSTDLSTQEEVDSYSGADFDNQIKSLTEDILGETEAPSTQTVGKLSPENAVVNSISKLFQKFQNNGTPTQKSVMKQMQDLVLQSANKFLEKTNSVKKTAHEALQDFFNLENSGFITLSGTMNGLQDLTKEVQRRVRDYVEQVAVNLDDDAADLLRQQWAAYTDSFVNSLYDITLSQSNQRDLLNSALKQIKLDGVSITDVNGNIKWSVLSEFGDPQLIKDKIADLFYNGITDNNGNVQKYTRAQADRIAEYLGREYEAKKANTIKRHTATERSKNMSAKNIISDFIKSGGYFNLVKDKNGKLLLTQADWNNLIKKIKQQVGDRTNVDLGGLEIVKVELQKYLDSQKDSNGNPKFNASQKQIITQEFIDTLAAKLLPESMDATDFDKLIALNNLHNGIAFNEATQQSLNKIVGVTNIEQAALQQIQQLSALANNIINGGNNVTQSTSTNPEINRGAYAYQALSDIERRIKEILRSGKISKSNKQAVVKYIGDTMGAATQSLLINPKNILENIITAFGSNIGESVSLLFKSPKLFRKAMAQSNKDFWNAWVNYVAGGSYMDVNQESDLSNELPSSERIRIRKVIDDVKRQGLLKGVLSNAASLPALATGIFSRTFMNSFDAAFSAAVLRKKTISSVYDALKSQGYSTSEVYDLMGDALGQNKRLISDVKKENNRIVSLMRSAGFPITQSFIAQNERNLMYSLYEDVLRDVASDKGATIQQATNAARALISASQTQAKQLNGKEKIKLRDFLSNRIYGAAEGSLKAQRSSFTKAKELEDKGELGKAAMAELIGSAAQNTLGRFIGGVANFATLGVSATFYGFFMARSAYRQGQEVLKQSPNSKDVLNANASDIKKFYEFQGMTRSLVTRAAMGTLAMAAFILKNMIIDDDDDNKEDGLYNLSQTRSGRRYISKFLPMGLAVLAAATYDSKNKKGKAENVAKRVLDVYGGYAGLEYSMYENLQKAFEYAKDEDDVSGAIVRALGSFSPTFNINQSEQITKFWDETNSFFDKSEIRTVEQNEKISRDAYKNIDGVVDAFLINGAIESISRMVEGNYNRYSK